MNDLVQKIERINRFLTTTVFEVVGNEAVNHFKRSFDNEGFTENGLRRWKEVKRRINPRKKKRSQASPPLAWDKAKILTQSGDLARSIRYSREGRCIVISANGYGAVHNEGLRAGRGKGFRMPKRQLIGKSRALTLTFNAKISQHLNAILKA